MLLSCNVWLNVYMNVNKYVVLKILINILPCAQSKEFGRIEIGKLNDKPILSAIVVLPINYCLPTLLCHHINTF